MTSEMMHQIPVVKGNKLQIIKGIRQKGMLPFLANCVYDYGDIFKLNLHKGFVVLSHPQYIKHWMDNSALYSRAVDEPPLSFLKIFLGDGLVTSSGEIWSKTRKVIQEKLHHKDITRFLKIMVEFTEATLNSWEEKSGVIDVAEEMKALIFGITKMSLLGTHSDDDTEFMRQNTDETLDLIFKLFSSPLPKFTYFLNRSKIKKYNQDTDNYVLDIISKRQEDNSSDQMDILAMLMNITDEETGECLSNRQIRDQLITFLGAGFETTANAVSWVLYYLSKHPAVRREVIEEIDSVLGSRRPVKDDLLKMKKLKASIQETLRLRPQFPMLHRKTKSEFTLNGHTIKENSYIIFLAQHVHMHPEYWENPEGFDITRFLDNKPDRTTYIPFGAGERFCVGAKFAMMEIQVVVAMILQKYVLDMESGFPVIPQYRVAIQPKNGLRMTLNKRKYSLER